MSLRQHQSDQDDLRKGARMGGLTVDQSERHDNTWDGIMVIVMVILVVALLAIPRDKPEPFQSYSEAQVDYTDAADVNGGAR